MKQQFVPYEIAIKLKEKGFNEPCLANYCDKDLIPYRGYPDEGDEDSNFSTTINENITSLWVTAPLWQQVIDWLSIVHNIHIGICHQSNGMFDIWKNNGNLLLSGAEYKEFKTHQEARQAAIEHALTLI